MVELCGLVVPGRHSALNATAAVALGFELLRETGGAVTAESRAAVREALEGFAGSRRRSEVVGTAGGVFSGSPSVVNVAGGDAVWLPAISADEMR